jgi:hypothetical protein
MTDQTFAGFEPLKGNFTQVPNQVFDLLPQLTGGEIKCLLYIVRHTLGFHDKVKTITIDEFENGRKRKDGTRIDDGAGIGHDAIVRSLKSLSDRNIITRETDARDKARQKVTYGLNLSENRNGDHSENQTTAIRKSERSGLKIGPRSVKETVADIPLEDALSKRIAAIIDAWKKLSKSLKGNPFKNTTYREYAEAMDGAGITAADVTLYVQEESAPGKYWHGKAVPFANVAENIGAWKAARTPVQATTPTPTQPADEEPFVRITPERRKELQAEYEATMAEIRANSADLPIRVAQQQAIRKIRA